MADSAEFLGDQVLCFDWPGGDTGHVEVQDLALPRAHGLCETVELGDARPSGVRVEGREALSCFGEVLRRVHLPQQLLAQDRGTDLAIGVSVPERVEELLPLTIRETLPRSGHETARRVERVVAVPPVVKGRVLDPSSRVVDRLVGEVRSDRGAVPASQQVRFPSPSPEPDVRLPPHPALHEPVPLDYGASIVTAHGEGITAPRYR